MSRGRFGNLALAPGKLAVVQKMAVAHLSSRLAWVVLVNEYPKSGGTWLKFMLADALGLPAWTKATQPWGSCVMQAHWPAPRGRCKTVALFRDGRDVMVSYYYHSFFRNEFQNGAYTRYMRERFQFDDYEDVRTNLLPFMKVMFDHPVSPGFSWAEFAMTWGQRPGVVPCHYEALRRDTAGALGDVVAGLTGIRPDHQHLEAVAARHTMAAMRARKIGDLGASGRQVAEKSFIRKGAVSGWSDSFTDEALAWFEDRAGHALQHLGYALGRPDQVGGAG